MLTSKALLIGGTTLASVGAGVGGYYLFHQSPIEEKTIAQLLLTDSANKNKTPLTANNKDNGWLEKWTSYISTNTTGNIVSETDILGISNWKSINNNKSTVPNEFAQKCEELSKSKIKNKEDQKYTNYTSWCIK